MIVLVHLFRCCWCFCLHPIWKGLGRRCPEQGKFGAATRSGETPKKNTKLTFEWDVDLDLDVDLQADLNLYLDLDLDFDLDVDSDADLYLMWICMWMWICIRI